MFKPAPVVFTFLGVLTFAPASIQAAPITLSAEAVFEKTNTGDGGGPDTTPNSFTIRNTSDAGVLLSQIKVILTGPLLFDTAAGTPGADPFHAFSPGGQPVGFVSSSLSADSKALTLTFNDFDPAEDFTFTIDVDRGDGNDGRNVPASQFADDAFIEFTFTGPFEGGSYTSAAWAFEHPANGESEPGLKAKAAYTGQAESQGNVPPLGPDIDPPVVPEPASVLLWSVIGVGAWAGTRCFRRRSPRYVAA